LRDLLGFVLRDNKYCGSVYLTWDYIKSNWHISLCKNSGFIIYKYKFSKLTCDFKGKPNPCYSSSILNWVKNARCSNEIRDVFSEQAAQRSLNYYIQLSNKRFHNRQSMSKILFKNLSCPIIKIITQFELNFIQPMSYLDLNCKESFTEIRLLNSKIRNEDLYFLVLKNLIDYDNISFKSRLDLMMSSQIKNNFKFMSVSRNLLRYYIDAIKVQYKLKTRGNFRIRNYSHYDKIVSSLPKMKIEILEKGEVLVGSDNFAKENLAKRQMLEELNKLFDESIRGFTPKGNKVYYEVLKDINVTGKVKVLKKNYFYTGMKESTLDFTKFDIASGLAEIESYKSKVKGFHDVFKVPFNMITKTEDFKKIGKSDKRKYITYCQLKIIRAHLSKEADDNSGGSFVIKTEEKEMNFLNSSSEKTENVEMLRELWNISHIIKKKKLKAKNLLSRLSCLKGLESNKLPSFCSRFFKLIASIQNKSNFVISDFNWLKRFFNVHVTRNFNKEISKNIFLKKVLENYYKLETVNYRFTVELTKGLKPFKKKMSSLNTEDLEKIKFKALERTLDFTVENSSKPQFIRIFNMLYKEDERCLDGMSGVLKRSLMF